MNRRITNLSASVLQRLKNEAKTRNQTFQEILTLFGLERFLYRLSRSAYRDLFVLKGALVMLAWPSRIPRTTRDIDFRVFTDSDMGTVLKIIREICTVNVEPDALRFDPDSVRLETITERAEYPGMRARLVGSIEAVRVPIQIDMGFSDRINPAPNVVEFPTILEFPAPIVLAYQPETVLAEKVEAIFYYGEINSRMKDFYDLWIISNEFPIQGERLVEAMRSTFQTRGTPIQSTLSTLFNEKFVESRSEMWAAFLAGIGEKQSALRQFSEVLSRTERFIQPALNAILNAKNLDETWNPSEGEWV